ncbi:MAG: SpoIIIAH-like family protein [Oscillospiraceae bacterium]|nr:SpoIIIAH-like family protein [Oscillospiraceae bacterium]
MTNAIAKKNTKFRFDPRISKRQIIITCLVLLLGIAVYANYQLTNTDLKATDVVTSLDMSDVYGEITYVNGTEIVDYSSDDYFAQARLEKLTSRDEAVETLKMMLDGGDLSDEELATYTEEAVALSSLIESETIVENLVIAAGFEDCVCYLDGENANIVVKSEGLTSAQAAQIKDILLSEVDVLNENIRIFEVK